MWFLKSFSCVLYISCLLLHMLQISFPMLLLVFTLLICLLMNSRSLTYFALLIFLVWYCFCVLFKNFSLPQVRGCILCYYLEALFSTCNIWNYKLHGIDVCVTQDSIFVTFPNLYIKLTHSHLLKRLSFHYYFLCPFVMNHQHLYGSISRTSFLLPFVSLYCNIRWLFMVAL